MKQIDKTALDEVIELVSQFEYGQDRWGKRLHDKEVTKAITKLKEMRSEG